MRNKDAWTVRLCQETLCNNGGYEARFWQLQTLNIIIVYGARFLS